MSIFIDKHELAEKEDIINPNLAYGVVKSSDLSAVYGNTQQASFTSPSDNNYCFSKTKLYGNFKKGDVVTISAFGNLTGKNAQDGYYKATIYNSDTSYCYDDNSESIFLTQGMWSSKQVVFNADTDPNNPPVLLFYCGKPGSTSNNTIVLNRIKVERGSVATQWCPAPEDYAMKSDLDALKAEIEQLKQNK